MFKSANITFLEGVLAGEISASKIDDYVDQWHDSPEEPRSLPEFLGLSAKEYSRWVLDAGALASIIRERSGNRDEKVEQFLELRRKLTLERHQLAERLKQIDAALGHASAEHHNGFVSRFHQKKAREMIAA